jgi:hypothetical protein
VADLGAFEADLGASAADPSLHVAALGPPLLVA